MTHGCSCKGRDADRMRAWICLPAFTWALENLDAPNVAVVLCREGDSCLLGRRLELRQPQSAQEMLPQLLIWDPWKPAKNASLYQALQIVGLTS